jgi:hypothetical protein
VHTDRNQRSLIQAPGTNLAHSISSIKIRRILMYRLQQVIFGQLGRRPGIIGERRDVVRRATTTGEDFVGGTGDPATKACLFELVLEGRLDEAFVVYTTGHGVVHGRLQPVGLRPFEFALFGGGFERWWFGLFGLRLNVGGGGGGAFGHGGGGWWSGGPGGGGGGGG